jgi:hypothetical protein
MNTLCIILALYFLFIGCGKSESANPESYDGPKASVRQKVLERPREDSEKQKKIIAYDVLRKWYPHNKKNNLGMELLVSPQASKADVITLSRNLWDAYKDKNILFILIFDSREAWRGRGSEKYPAPNYWKHFLVSIIRNNYTGHKEMLWVKDGVREKIPH